MDELLYREIKKIRNPFRVIKMPLMARLCKYWYDNLSKKKFKQQKAKFARACFVYFYRLGVKSEGLVEFQRSENHYKIKFDARNTQFSSLYLEKYREAYESEIAVLLDLLVPLSGVFFDVGANYGYFSLYVASLSNFSGKIFSFEPHPYSYKDMNDFVNSLGLNGIIRPFHLAAYFRKDTFFVKPSGVRSGNFTLDDRSDSQKGAHKVQMDRLDNLNCPVPDVIKIDTDGSEASVLKGCSGFLVKSQPFIIFESSLYNATPYKTIEPFDILQRSGYVFYYPGWLEKVNGSGSSILRNSDDITYDRKRIIALSLFNSEQRFLFTERLNILAVHKNRLPELKKIFNIEARTE